jgi:DNA-binding response OmpR family regulator
VNQRVLLIDDDPAVHEVSRPYLEREGYVVYSAPEGRAGLEMCATRDHVLVVLDRILPDIPGERVLAEVRRRSMVPVIMISGAADVDARVEAFALGADDYLVKPFSPRELAARAKAIIRRRGGVASSDVLRFTEGLEIDALRHEVRLHGRPCNLTVTEYNVLVALAQHPGRVYSRGELAYRARGHDFEGYDRTVDAHIKNLRQRLGEDPARPLYVETVRGVGYRLGVDPA